MYSSLSYVSKLFRLGFGGASSWLWMLSDPWFVSSHWGSTMQGDSYCDDEYFIVQPNALEHTQILIQRCAYGYHIHINHIWTSTFCEYFFRSSCSQTVPRSWQNFMEMNHEWRNTRMFFVVLVSFIFSFDGYSSGKSLLRTIDSCLWSRSWMLTPIYLHHAVFWGRVLLIFYSKHSSPNRWRAVRCAIVPIEVKGRDLQNVA